MNVAYYNQRWATENDLESAPSPQRLNQVVDLLKSYSQPQSGKRLIDVGCGNGWILERIAGQFPGIFELWGLEPSASGIANSRKRIPTAHLFEQTLDSFSPPHRFDYLICSEVIEHVDDSRRFLSQLADLLVDDGLAIVTTPNGYFRDRFFRGPFKDCEQPIENWLTVKLFSHSANRLFEVILLDTFNPQHFYSTFRLNGLRSIVDSLPLGKHLRRASDRMVCQIFRRGLYIRAVLRRRARR